MAAGPEDAARTLIGRLRVHMADTLETAGVAVRSAGPRFLWVVDFPLFVREEGLLVAAHHPFTRPHEEDEGFVYTYPEQVRLSLLLGPSCSAGLFGFYFHCSMA